MEFFSFGKSVSSLYLETGLKSLDVNISYQCASAVDDLAVFYFNNLTMEGSPRAVAALNMAQHIADCPNLFPKILRSLFEIVLFEECSNQWNLSRSILSLILMNDQIFNGLKV
jgi:exportin-7